MTVFVVIENWCNGWATACTGRIEDFQVVVSVHSTREAAEKAAQVSTENGRNINEGNVSRLDDSFLDVEIKEMQVQ